MTKARKGGLDRLRPRIGERPVYRHFVGTGDRVGFSSGSECARCERSSLQGSVFSGTVDPAVASTRDRGIRDARLSSGETGFRRNCPSSIGIGGVSDGAAQHHEDILLLKRWILVCPLAPASSDGRFHDPQVRIGRVQTHGLQNHFLIMVAARLFKYTDDNLLFLAPVGVSTIWTA